MSSAINSLDLSVVVPVGPKDSTWEALATQLPAGIEVIWAIGQRDIEEFRNKLELLRAGENNKIVTSEPGRANQMNEGTKEASGKLVWYLHADSLIYAETLKALASFKHNENQIGYFDLRFHDGSALMRITEVGVLLRCWLINLPFGDQGLVVPKNVFNAVGGFPEGTIGEDLIFVRKASLKGVKIVRVKAPIGTSARKYTGNWLKTTFSHIYWTWKLLRQC